MIVKGFLPVPDSNFLVHWVLVACSGCMRSANECRHAEIAQWTSQGGHFYVHGCAGGEGSSSSSSSSSSSGSG